MLMYTVLCICLWKLSRNVMKLQILRVSTCMDHFHYLGCNLMYTVLCICLWKLSRNMMKLQILRFSTCMDHFHYLGCNFFNMFVSWIDLCYFWRIQNKTDRHNINEVLLKVSLNTITLTQNIYLIFDYFVFYKTIYIFLWSLI